MVSFKINSFVWIEFIGMVNENQTKPNILPNVHLSLTLVR